MQTHTQQVIDEMESQSMRYLLPLSNEYNVCKVEEFDVVFGL